MTPGWAAWLFPTWIATLVLAGWAMRSIGFDRGFEEALEPQRHRHRIGTPQESTLLELPRAGVLEPQPEPDRHDGFQTEWTFFGAQVAPAPGRDEYELMTRTTQTMAVVATSATAAVKLPGDGRPEETPSAWTRRQALEMDAFIKGMVEESNYYQHTILASGTRHSRREGGVR